MSFQCNFPNLASASCNLDSACELIFREPEVEVERVERCTSAGLVIVFLSPIDGKILGNFHENAPAHFLHLRILITTKP